MEFRRLHESAISVLEKSAKAVRALPSRGGHAALTTEAKISVPLWSGSEQVTWVCPELPDQFKQAEIFMFRHREGITHEFQGVT